MFSGFMCFLFVLLVVWYLLCLINMYFVYLLEFFGVYGVCDVFVVGVM